MPKWEYAAIVRDGTKRIYSERGDSKEFPRWALVKPGKEPYTVRSRKAPSGKIYYIDDCGDSWTKPYGYISRRQKNETTGYEYNDSEPEILFEANDILILVNLAGAHGWEITGGLGLGDGSPGNHETKWRIMRREL